MADDRTVTVRLEASVAGYIRDIRLAAAATDAAFRSSTRSATNLNRGMRDVTSSMNDLRTTSERTRTTLTGFRRDIDNVGESSNRTGNSFNRMSGRLKLFAQATAILGPGLVPIAAVGTAAIAGLAAQLGFAALAGGTAVLAFQGVGDALDAMSKAHLEPTKENLLAAQIAMEGLSPAAQDLVTQLRSLSDEGRRLRDSAAEGFLPGVSQSLDELLTRLPQVERILREVGDAAGDALAGGAESLASSRWDDFFNFLETDARQTLSDLAVSVGNVTHALASLLMATDPLADSFSSWLVDATARFDRFATGLDQTEGFQDFIDYVRTSGPQVASAMGAIGSAMVDIAQAAAPLGGTVLAALEAIANVVSALASSNFGTPILAGLAAMSLMSRATKLWGATAAVSARTATVGFLSTVAGLNAVVGAQQRATLSVAQLAAAQRASAAATRAARLGMVGAAAGLAAMAVSQTQFGKATGVSNTMMFAGLGMIAGPWGAAIGGAVGLTMDLAGANDDLAAAIKASSAAIQSGSAAAMVAVRDQADAAVAAAEANSVFGKEMGWVGALVNAAAPLSNVSKLMGSLTGDTEEAAAASDALAAAFANLPTEPALLGAGEAAMAAAFREATAAAKEYAAALTEVYGLLDQRGAVRAAKASLDDFTAGLKENGNSMNDNTRAGRENLANLDEIARSHNIVAEGMKASNRIPYLRTARADFVDAAMKLGMTRSRARNLATELGLLNTLKVSPDVDVNTKGAEAGVRRLGGLFNTLPDKVQTDIAANGIPKTMGQVNKLVEKYGLTERERRALITLKDAASGDIKAIMKLLAKADRTKTNPTINANNKPAISSTNAVEKKLNQLDKKKTNPKIDANSGPAIAAANAVERRLNAINDEVVNISVVTTHKKKFVDAHGPPVLPTSNASGGHIRGPGTSTSDSIPLWGSDGEFMVKAAAVEKYGTGFLHKVNDMRLASGGEVNWQRAGSWNPNTGPTMHRAATRSPANSGSSSGHMTVTGTLDSPLGLIRIVEGVASVVARAEADADAEYNDLRNLA